MGCCTNACAAYAQMPSRWAVVASRQALSSGTQWGAVLPRLGFLVLLAAAMAWLATRAFRAYQRSA